MTKAGRKTKLNPELREQIVKYIEAGNFIKDACEAVGIGETTFYEWLKKGREGIKPFREFRESIKKAKAKAVIRNVLIIQKAAKETWQAAAWWLERTHPKNWGRKESIKIKEEVSLGKQDSKALKDFLEKEKLLTPKQREKFLKIALKFEKDIAEEEKEYKA